MKNLKYQTYKLKYKDFPLGYDFIKNVDAQPQDLPYNQRYFTTVALEDGTISFHMVEQTNTDLLKSMSYSLDNGKIWNTVQNIDSEGVDINVNVSTGDKILWKGDGISLCMDIRDSELGLDLYGSFFSSESQFNVEGNVMSLLYGDNFSNKTTLNVGFEFADLFFDGWYKGRKTNLVSAENLILPATTLSIGCYAGMFNGCTNLILAPELPATTLAQSCYSSMFDGCSSLTTAPELPATTLDGGCYAGMFTRCTSLTTAPELPATTLAYGCYQAMFQDCTSLTTAPELYASTLTNGCYDRMFNGCTKLNYIKAMFITTPSTDYTKNWVKGIASTGTFIKNSAATWNVTGNNGVPTGWTVETADTTN